MSKVIVVGGGVAGLAAARKLKRSGVEALVLEAQGRAGGRVSTLHREDAIVDTGAQFFGPREPYVNTFALLDELGLLADVQAASHHAAMVKRGKPHSYRYGSAADFLKLPVLSLASKLRMLKVLPEMKRYAPLLDFHHLERAESIDDQDVAGFIAHLAGSDVLDHLIQPLMSALYYYPRHGISRALLLALVHGLGDLGTHSLSGGNQQLTDRLASELDVIVNARVLAVAPETGGKIEVTWDQNQARKTAAVDAVVMAAPADIALEICPGLNPLEREFLASVRYTACVGAAFRTERRFGGPVYGTAIAAEESKTLASVTFEQNKNPDRVPEGVGLTLAFLNAEASATMINRVDDEIKGDAAAELERLWPGHTRSTQWSAVIRHPRATPLFGVGSIRRLKGFLERRERTPHLSFCGDYLCGPHLEGAITSGLRAADDVLLEVG